MTKTKLSANWTNLSRRIDVTCLGLVAERDLDIEILKEVAAKKW
jgi:hypothetical protein